MHAADKERSELLLHLSDVKAEAKSNELNLERVSHAIPELKLLLEKSEKQKGKVHICITKR